MKQISFLLLFVVFGINTLFAAPYFVRINGATDYAAAATGQTDFQGRTQYLAASIPLNAGDVLTCYDGGSQAEWAISALDAYGAYANFTTSASGITCNTEGCYNIYIKLKYQDDMLYIEEGTGCNGEPPEPTLRPVNEAVLLQGFYWDSNIGTPAFGFTRWNDLYKISGDISANFDYVWLPPSAFSTGGTGYMPRQWSNQYSDWGTEPQLCQLINAMKVNGCKSIADIVVNHRADNGVPPYNQFYPDDFGTYGQFQLLPSDVCSDDDVAGTGAPDAPYEGFDGARDLDHSSNNVKQTIRAYLKWLKNVIGYDGWRYDMVKGFPANVIGDYNYAAGADISVGEYWDGNQQRLKDWVDGTGQNSMVFDFALKYNGINSALAGNNYANFANGLCFDAYYRNYAVTFVDNHDTYRNQNGNDKYTGDVLKANAFILSSPGIPCVFYPHWKQNKEQINAMIKARKSVGLRNNSEVLVQNISGYYKSLGTGSCGQMLTYIGTTNDAPDASWELAASGNGYKIYTKITDTACAAAHQQGIDNAQNPIIDDTPIGTITITAVVPADWTAPKIYIWGMTTTPAKEYACAWSGSPMTNVGTNKFSYTLSDVSDSEIGVVINNGLTGANIKQTIDIQNIGASTSFELSAMATMGGKYGVTVSGAPVPVTPAAPCITGIDEVEANKFSIYPNPVNDELRITNYELREGDKVEILDIAGKTLFTIHYSLFTAINVSGLQQGVYFVKIGNQIEKFIKK